eukprot:GHVL01018768.1.p2 GENE.GHVL01018768.1~~GHVL01018768.1.p2  ORF type:complete len:138 (+),score=26.56 GHVL01018768.1:993-1406(+)
MAGSRKIGGNAQSMSKNQFVHHTSFLWNANIQKMEAILAMPERQPKYRDSRSHKDFVGGVQSLLQGQFSSMDDLRCCIEENFIHTAINLGCEVEYVDFDSEIDFFDKLVQNFSRSNPRLQVTGYIDMDGNRVCSSKF